MFSKVEIEAKAEAIESAASKTVSQDTPLYQCVENALGNFFKCLDGEPPNNLYQLVLGEVEAPLLKAVLDYTRGNRCQAAKILGLNRGTLRKKMLEYQIDTGSKDE